MAGFGCITRCCRCSTLREWAGTWWPPGISPPSSSSSGIRNSHLLEYCKSKKTCPLVYSEYTMKIWQDLFSIQHIQNLNRPYIESTTNPAYHMLSIAGHLIGLGSNCKLHPDPKQLYNTVCPRNLDPFHIVGCYIENRSRPLGHTVWVFAPNVLLFSVCVCVCVGGRGGLRIKTNFQICSFLLSSFLFSHFSLLPLQI